MDASATIGLGHAVRCLALAEILKDRFEITFCCAELPSPIASQIKEKKFQLQMLSSESQLFDDLKKEDIVVLDHYSLDSAYQKQIKEKGCGLACIDDIHDREFFADLIINHNPGVKAGDYKAKPYTMFALGTDYLLLRPAFLHHSRRPEKRTGRDSVFICFGGADPKGLTLKALAVCQSFPELKKITVVTGVQNEEVKKFAEADHKIRYCHSLNDTEMLALMLESDIAIVPSSGILLEALAAGCRAISGMYVPNQKLIYSHFKDQNYFIDAGEFTDEQLKQAITKAIHNDTEKNISRLKPQPDKILKLFLQLSESNKIKLKRASEQELDITYSWAADPKVRAHSFSKHQITKEEHSAWFLRKISDKNCEYLVFFKNERAIGSVRFDIEKEKARISYLLDPAFHGQGLGTIILQKALEYLYFSSPQKPELVYGEVFQENHSSLQTFRRLGFDEKISEECYLYAKLGY
jgi:UDP-2,4-diacetamido-2,4,6-trideoxy-beta-L-altropyranose hydrolase